MLTNTSLKCQIRELHNVIVINGPTSFLQKKIDSKEISIRIEDGLVKEFICLGRTFPVRYISVDEDSIMIYI